MAFPTWLPILLGALTAVAPLSIDMYLPAFPAIEAALSAPGQAPVTLAAFFAGLSVGQLVQGPLADRLGRRTPLLWGMALYTIASAGCAVAPDLGSLSALRAAAAFGGSAGMVVPRAIVRDLATGTAAARLMSRLILVMGVAPVLAPSLGGLLLGISTWRALFWVLAGYGMLATVAIWRLLPETLPPERRRIVGPRGIARDYIAILGDRRFLSPALAGSFGVAGLFAYIATSPAVFLGHYGMSPRAYAMLFGVNAAGYIAGAQLNSWMISRFSPEQVLRWSVRAFGATALLLLVFSLAQVPSGWWLMVPITLCMATLGLAMSNAAVEALHHQGARAGSASAMMGTQNFLLGALFGAAAALLADGTPLPMAVMMLVGALGSALAEQSRRWKLL